MAEREHDAKNMKTRDDRQTGESLDEKLLKEQTLVNERRMTPGEQAPSARMRSPAERDRARAETHSAPSQPEVPPMETRSVKRISEQSKPVDDEEDG